MAFMPKFVDLVRNVATATGTGPVTLGAAVSGFTSLTQALQAGDRFYYCLQGVDKPQEREVGRGTLLADGTVAREPVSGGLTSFTGGAKTIALVAAAEWFARLDAMSPGGSIEAASRAELAATIIPPAGSTRFLREAGREGLFSFDPSDLSGQVAVDTEQAITIAPASDPTGASGAWVRQWDGARLQFQWFGAVADDNSDSGTDNGPALLAAVALMEALCIATPGIYNRGGPGLDFGLGWYYLGTTTLEPRLSCIIEGHSAGGSGEPGTRLRWAAGTTAIRLQDVNTYGATDTGAFTWGAASTIIRNLGLKGGYVTGVTPEGEHHGIHVRATAVIEDVSIVDFQGDGIFANTSAPNGNSNVTRVSRLRIVRTRHGLYLGDADANVWHVESVDVTYGRRAGFFDSSFLGNSYVACHTADCGAVAGNHTPSAVSHGGNWYTPVLGEEAWCATNAPSGTATNNQGWIYLYPGAPTPSFNVPAWLSGMTVRAGGSYISDNANARNLFVGCYAEGGMPGAQLAAGSLAIGGWFNGSPVYNGSGFLFADGGAPASHGGFRALDPGGADIRTRLGSGAGSDPILSHINAAMLGTPGMQLSWFNNILHWTMWTNYYGNDAIPMQFSGYTTSIGDAPWGTARLNFPQGFGLAGKKVRSGTAAPVADAWLVGDMVFNSAPSAGGPMGWMCVTAGTPGTWKAMANIEA